MTVTEGIAVLMTLVGIALTIRQNAACWPVGIVGILAYLVVFIRARLYADAALQPIYMAQSLYGWWFWSRGGRTGERPAPIVTLHGPARLGVIVATALTAAVVGTGLARWTDASAPYADATLSATSLAANWLLARKVLENWILWMLVNIGYVLLFWRKNLHLSSGLYVVLLGLAVAGWLEWKRARRLQQVGDLQGAIA